MSDENKDDSFIINCIELSETSRVICSDVAFGELADLDRVDSCETSLISAWLFVAVPLESRMAEI